MEEVFDLVAPELGLVLDFSFTGEIFYDEDRLVGDLGFLDTEFKILFFRGMGPLAGRLA